MRSHTKPSVAFRRLLRWQEKWRDSWYPAPNDENAIHRPTEDEALTIIFLKERGLYGDR